MYALYAHPPVSRMATHRLRPLARASATEFDWVTLGMHLTLVEVAGEEGRREYPLSYMRARLASFLDPAQHTAEVFLAIEDGANTAPEVIAGHTILRIDAHPAGGRFGLFSTTYVHPDARRHGLADRLLERGEAWIRANGLDEAATWTSSTNTPLIRLYEKHGYAVTDSGPNGSSWMVRLTRSLGA
jgi:GNAT superfamily N-acetyltransferase